MRLAWVNIALLIFVLLQVLTGVGGLIAGAESWWWLLWLHGLGGYATVVLLWWKGEVVLAAWRYARRHPLERVAFITAIVLLLGTLATGLIWTFSGRVVLNGFSLITFHIGLAVALSVLLVWHVLAMRFVFQARGIGGRRTFLRLAGVAGAGLALAALAGRASTAAGLAGSRRRFTGSYEVEGFTGQFPSVSWLFDDLEPVSIEQWHLTVDGAVERPLTLTYDDILQLGLVRTDALLDCTGGWFTWQLWQGVNVGALLELARPSASAKSVTVESVSGYQRRFSIAEIGQFLLATHVADRPLGHEHGFPLRLVAPGFRGFAWVKWIRSLHVNLTSEIWQPPLPLQ